MWHSQSSVCERRAERKQRENLDKLKKAEYMSYHIGEEFEGIISGVTGWGFYVELPNTVEGLVHVNTLRDDYYTFDQDAYELIGDVTHKVFALGQKVRVRVADADTMLKTVEFCSGRGARVVIRSYCLFCDQKHALRCIETTL